MAFYQPKDARSALLPITSICWFFGIGIIEYPLGNPRRIIGFLYSIVVYTSFLTSCVVFYLFYSPSHWLIHLQSWDEVYIAHCSVATIVVGINLFFGTIHSKKRSHCIITLQEIDGIMEEMGIVHSYQPFLMAQIWQFGSLVFTSILQVGFMSRDYVVHGRNFGIAEISHTWIFLLYPIVVSTIYEIMFCNFNAMLTSTFKDLNSLLESFRFKLLDRSYHTGINPVLVGAVSIEKRGLKMLYSIRKIYSRLVRLANQSNRLNAAFILTDTSHTVLRLTHGIFVVYELLAHDKFGLSANYWFTARFLLQASFYLCKLVMVVRSVVRLAFEANRTSDIVLEHLYRIPSLRSEVRTFSMQLIHNPLRFSVFGLYQLNYSVIQEIITTVITYSIVITQMSKLPKVSVNHKEL